MARSLLHTSQASVTSMQKTTLPSVTLEQTSWSALVRVSFEFRSFSQKCNSGSLRTRFWCRSGDARCCSTSSWCRQAWKRIKTLFCKWNPHLEILWSVLAVSQGLYIIKSEPNFPFLKRNVIHGSPLYESISSISTLEKLEWVSEIFTLILLPEVVPFDDWVLRLSRDQLFRIRAKDRLEVWLWYHVIKMWWLFNCL